MRPPTRGALAAGAPDDRGSGRRPRPLLPAAQCRAGAAHRGRRRGGDLAVIRPSTRPIRGSSWPATGSSRRWPTGVVVVEAAARSGALNTASWAADRGIPVMAFPGDVGRPKAAGCLALIRDGAILVRDAADVLAQLGLAACRARRGRRSCRRRSARRRILAAARRRAGRCRRRGGCERVAAGSWPWPESAICWPRARSSAADGRFRRSPA